MLTYNDIIRIFYLPVNFLVIVSVLLGGIISVFAGYRIVGIIGSALVAVGFIVASFIGADQDLVVKILVGGVGGYHQYKLPLYIFVYYVYEKQYLIYVDNYLALLQRYVSIQMYEMYEKYSTEYVFTNYTNLHFNSQVYFLTLIMLFCFACFDLLKTYVILIVDLNHSSKDMTKTSLYLFTRRRLSISQVGGHCCSVRILRRTAHACYSIEWSWCCTDQFSDAGFDVCR